MKSIWEFIILVLILSFPSLQPVFAQAPAVPEKTEVSSDEDEAPPAAPVRRKRLERARPDYMKSKFTMDRSEMEADHRTLILATGVDKLVDLESALKLSDKKDALMIGNDAVVRVAVKTVGGQSQLIFKPIVEGETNVTVRDVNDQVRIIFDVIVAKQNQIRYYERLKENLKEVEGLNITLDDKNIVIRGEVLTVGDYSTVYNEISDKAYGDYVVNKVTMSPVTMGILARKIEQDLQSVVAPTIKVEVINGKIVLGGTVDDDFNRSRAFSRAYYFLPAIRVKEPIAGATNVEVAEQEKEKSRFFILQNDIQVNPPPKKRESKLVRITVYFVELSKDFLKSFAFKWAPGFSADPTISIGTNTAGAATAGGQGGFSFSAVLTSLFPSLAAPPSSSNYGRIMKSATVVVKSGNAGVLEDVISLPTQAIGQNGTVASGPSSDGPSISVNVTPTILQGQDVDVDVKINQKNVVGKGVGNQPIISSHKLESRVYLKSGEVAAVGAVNKQDVSTTFNRDDPSAGQSYQAGQGTTKTSALFSLMRSKAMSKARGQFVIFLSPTVIDSASEGTEDLKKNFRMTSGSN